MNSAQNAQNEQNGQSIPLSCRIPVPSAEQPPVAAVAENHQGSHVERAQRRAPVLGMRQLWPPGWHAFRNFEEMLHLHTTHQVALSTPLLPPHHRNRAALHMARGRRVLGRHQPLHWRCQWCCVRRPPTTSSQRCSALEGGLDCHRSSRSFRVRMWKANLPQEVAVPLHSTKCRFAKDRMLRWPQAKSRHGRAAGAAAAVSAAAQVNPSHSADGSLGPAGAAVRGSAKHCKHLSSCSRDAQHSIACAAAAAAAAQRYDVVHVRALASQRDHLLT